MSQKTLVIVPTYNERENLPPLIEQLMKLPVAVEVLVVDDHSPDGTGQLADEIAARNPAVHVLHRKLKNGLGAYSALIERLNLSRSVCVRSNPSSGMLRSRAIPKPRCSLHVMANGVETLRSST